MIFKKETRNSPNGQPADKKQHDPTLEATGSKGKQPEPPVSTFNDEEYARWSETLKKKQGDSPSKSTAGPSHIAPFLQAAPKKPGSHELPN